MSEKRGKRYRESLGKVPNGKLPVAEAVKIIKSFPTMKFDPTVELVMHLGVDPRQADQIVRGSISLPHGIGAARKVIAFCEGEDVDSAKAAGAVEAGGDELIKKIEDGWVDFDVAVSTKAMMKSVSRLGRILGPQGKMPSPKAGTVVDDVPGAVKEYTAGKMEFRNDEGGNLHVRVGKASFDPEKLTENVEAFLARVRRMRPTSTKGAYIRKACLSASMSPSVQLEV